MKRILHKEVCNMKKVLALVLCLLMVGQLLACSLTAKPQHTGGTTTKPTLSSLMSSYTLTTTTHPDGTTTVTLVPPSVTTRPSSGTSGTTVPGSSTGVVGPTNTTIPGFTTTRPGSTTGTGGTGTLTTTVTVPQVTTDPEVLTLGKTSLLLESIGATYYLYTGNIPVNKVLWASQNEGVATVKNGVVTAVSMGTTRIYASYKDQTVYCTVTVQLPTTDPEVFTLNRKSISLLQGSTQNIYSGNVDVSKITWASQNPKVATFTNGTVKAVAPGTTTVTATYGGKSLACTVTVHQPTTDPGISVAFKSQMLTMSVGTSQNIYAGTVPVDQVTFSTTNAQIVSINKGVVVAHRAGQAVVQASYQGYKAICTITVQQTTTDPTTHPTTGTTTGTTTTTTTPTTTRPSTSSTSTAPTPVYGNHTPVPYTQRYYYTQLGTQEQGWYRAIDAAVANLEDSVTLTGSFSDPKWYTIYFIYMFDNPEHFYLGAKVAYSNTGKLLFSYSDGINNSYHKGAENGDLSSLTATMRQNIRSRKATFDAEVDRIIATVPTNIPAVEKQKMLYDRLIIDMYYNQEAVWDYVADSNWNAYGGIIEKRGVCEAYAESFQTLCYAVGINCTGVVGTANGGGHKWNAVMLEGQWYMCDVTFDDPVGAPSGVAKFHSYFNLTSAELFAKGHSTTDSDYPGPTCTATKYSYKNYFG